MGPWVLALLVFAPRTAADSLLLVDDVEGKLGPWGGMEVVSDPVHGGKAALRWQVATRPTLDSPSFLGDWTAFDELRFWAYLDHPVDFQIPLVFPSEGGYYLAEWRLDWSGWKEQRIRLADCRQAYEPQGWDRIQHFGFRAQGYGQGPVPEDLVLVFDDFALHAPGELPDTSLEAWIARGRRERMEQLKARGNPYYLSVLESLRNLKPEPSLPAEVTSAWQFSGLASQALCAAWAAGWAESPRRGDSALVAHAAALIDFCLSRQVDGSWFYSRQWPSGDPNADRFALGPLMDAVYWLRKLPEGEARWAAWSTPLKQLVDFQYTHWGKRSGHAWSGSATRYPNQDVFHLYEMALAHRFWGDPGYAQSVGETLEGLAAHLLPGGGFNYIGPETEIPCYHDLNVWWIARYLALTGDERARDLLARTVEYYPSTCSAEGRPEYYTDCWWKHYWSDGAAAGPEVIAGLTGDGRNKWLADRLLERLGVPTNHTAIYAGVCYRTDVAPQAPDDSYVRFDPDIGGPRGRFGSWYFAGVAGGGARDTFVGAMLCRPDRPQPLDAALLAANIEVALGGEGARDRTHLYVSGPDDLTSVAIGTDSAALGARYWPRQPYINSVPSPSIPPTPWVATQVWLLSRHGLVGLVELEAAQEQSVPYIGGEVRLGPEQKAQAVAEVPGVFVCGDLRVQLLEHGFGTVSVGPARPGYAQTSTAHSAVTLRTAGDRFVARPGEPLRYVVAVAPKETPPFGDYARLEAPGVWGFTGAFGGSPVAVAFNPGDAPVSVRIPWPGALAKARLGLAPAAPIRATEGHVTLQLAPATAVLVSL